MRSETFNKSHAEVSECSFMPLFKHQNNFPSYIFAYKEKIPSTIMHWGY